MELFKKNLKTIKRYDNFYMQLKLNYEAYIYG